MTSLRSRLLEPLAWAASKHELQPLLRRQSLPDIVQATDAYRGRGVFSHISALHDPRETLKLAEIVQDRFPRTILEIGTCWGGTLFVWCRSNPQASLIISMDLPGGKFGGGYASERTKLYQQFAAGRPQLDLRLLRADSHQPQSLEQVKSILAGRPLDFLFIDGDHSYAGVKSDFLMYGPLVGSGGIIAFHDIRTLTGDHEVHRFWREIRGRYRTEEIIADPERPEYGIGVLYCDGSAR